LKDIVFPADKKPKPQIFFFDADTAVRVIMAKLGIETLKGVHVGIHCFRHGVTSEMLESGTPIHVVTRLMRHADSNVTLEHHAHIVGDAV
jgi:integrase